MSQREQWDAIVIGSGLGGLACAAYLCASGKRTLVLESHYVAGGNTQTFRRRRHGRLYEFDVGVHYIGECGPEGTITRVLRGLGLDDRIRFLPLDPDGYTTLVFPDLRFRIPTGWDRYRARLLETFPQEAPALGRVVDVLEAVAAGFRRLGSGQTTIADLATQAPETFAWALRPVTELFAEHRLSARAQAVLLGEQGTYAVRPSRTPTALAAGIMDHYSRGAFYPEGGGQVIAARLVEAIRAWGGEVRMRTPVGRVRIAGGRVAGVTLAPHGEEIDAPIVVSNADLKRTVLELVGPEHFSRETVERVRALRMALPLFVVYLGVERDLAADGVPNTSYMMWGDYDLEAMYDELEAGRIPEKDFVYVTAATLKDPGNPRLAPPGHTNLQIMTLAPSDYALWGVSQGPAQAGNAYHQDQEYRRRKSQLAERLISTAERVLPGLRERIDWRETASPLTQERFTRSTGGTSYGIEFSVDQMGPMRPGPQTEIPGLFLAGASTPSGHGIAGVLAGGLATAGAVLETDLRRRVLDGEILGDRDLLPLLRDDWDPWRESH